MGIDSAPSGAFMESAMSRQGNIVVRTGRKRNMNTYDHTGRSQATA